MTSSPDRALQEAVREHLVREVAQHGDRAIRAPGNAHPGRMGDRFRVAAAALVVTATVAASWFAIRAVQHRHDGAPPAHSVSPTPRTTASGQATVTEVLPDASRQVVGRGKFTGAVKGSFTITQSHGPVLHLRGFNPGRITSRQLLVAVDLASAQCRAQGVGTLAGTITSKPDQDVLLMDSSPQMYSDLSYMHAISIWPDGGCTGSSTAAIPAATIHWQLPAALRALASSDEGSRPAARGTVRERSGRPIRYTVASGDLISDVAARFGITTEDLLYLNPLRRHGSDSTLYAGEQLNLDPLDRAYFWR